MTSPGQTIDHNSRAISDYDFGFLALKGIVKTDEKIGVMKDKSKVPNELKPFDLPGTSGGPSLSRVMLEIFYEESNQDFVELFREDLR